MENLNEKTFIENLVNDITTIRNDYEILLSRILLKDDEYVSIAKKYLNLYKDECKEYDEKISQINFTQDEKFCKEVIILIKEFNRNLENLITNFFENKFDQNNTEKTLQDMNKNMMNVYTYYVFYILSKNNQQTNN
jgi:hypothetical protein